MDRRPTLALSPRRLRPRRAIPPRYPCAPPLKKSPGTNSKKTQPTRSSISGASLFRPDSDSISSELLSISQNPNFSQSLNSPQTLKSPKKTLNSPQTLKSLKTLNSSPNKENNQLLYNSIAPNSNLLFERGRMYDLYSARRNERLRRRQSESMEESEVEKVLQNPAIAVELQKKRVLKRNEMANVRNSISGDVSVSRIPTLRSSLRNSKDLKKVGNSGFSNGNLGFEEKSGTNGGTSVRRIGTRSAVKRY